MDVSNAAYALPDRELVLDRYRPLRPVGRGGSGSVWLARDERSGLEVALKIVPREGKRAARAMREMEAASRLRHPRCVRAYDFGGDDGHVYIAYEYVAGSTMRELMRAGKLTDREAVEAAAQILEGLAHAHQHGIVHRDVKPSNVIVEDAPSLSLRLLDFGLAQFDEADTLTAMGDVPGTLAYIAPERLAGADASARSDVWAVGVLLWEALAGQHPFWGVPLPQVAATIAGGAPPLASQRPDLPRRLLALVDAALEVDPERRPTARRLAHELREAYAAPRRQRTRGEQPDAAARPGRARAPRPRPSARIATGGITRPTTLLRAGAAVAATAVGGAILPFWPPGLLALLAVAAGLAALRLPRLSLAVVLFAPLFPLGNLATGAALAYGAVAAAWLVVTWAEPRKALLFCAGPALAAIGLIALLPLAVWPSRSPLRRALHALAGVLSAALVAGAAGRDLPFTDVPAESLGIAGEESALAVAGAVLGELASHPGILAGALVVSLSAATLPFARRAGRVGIGALLGAQLVALLVLAPQAPVIGVVLGTLGLASAMLTPELLGHLRRSPSEQPVD